MRIPAKYAWLPSKVWRVQLSGHTVVGHPQGLNGYGIIWDHTHFSLQVWARDGKSNPVLNMYGVRYRETPGTLACMATHPFAEGMYDD